MEDTEEGTFGELLARYRTQARWNQQRLAKGLGVHRSTIVKWELKGSTHENWGKLLHTG